MPYHGWESRRSHLVVFEVLTLSGSQWSEWTNSHSVQTQKCAPWTAVLSCRRQRESSRRLPLRCISICSFRMARMKYTDMISQAKKTAQLKIVISLIKVSWLNTWSSIITNHKHPNNHLTWGNTVIMAPTMTLTVASWQSGCLQQRRNLSVPEKFRTTGTPLNLPSTWSDW